ncbi:hypothetical protein [Methylosinus sp. Sm6]|uniref:hypothetical protein n=1 Tax=Methylosinus sp. Sm6 TaxID=2866948 RepID=UPI001C993451|nr:hypothetical protein [Methylosinus sp. Sm6]MBY6239802.1 hypothetical protein [Methylosinus sp. Sm6]
MTEEIAVNLRLPDVYHPEQADHLPPDLIGATILAIGAAPSRWGIEGGGLVIEYRPSGRMFSRRTIVLGNTELGMWIDAAHSSPPESDDDAEESVEFDVELSKEALERGVSALVAGLGGGATHGPWDHDRMVMEIFAAIVRTAA